MTSSATECARPGAVAVFRTDAAYGAAAPYPPPRRYPENPSRDEATDPANGAYEAVRETFALLGLDRERFGTADWNPLGETIQPGMRVTLVPNLLTGRHHETGALITHPSIVRAVMDYVGLALKGRGTITVLVTTPMGESWGELLAATGLSQVISEVRKRTPAEVRIVDPRRRVLRWIKCGRVDLWKKWIGQPGDEAGYVSYSMGTESWFRGLEERMGRMVGGLRRPTREDFRPGRVRYEIPRAVADADVLIAMPKLKTHMKSAVTLCVKGWVGLMSNRSGLPHYRHGPPSAGGDEYADGQPWRFRAHLKLRRACNATTPGQNLFGLLSKFTSRIDAWSGGRLLCLSRPADGGWYGNDTIWRACLDLHRIAVFGDRNGAIADRPQRKVLCLVDGMIAGEGEGPYRPTPLAAGVLVAGDDPLAVDCVATRLMGLDPALVPMLARGLSAFLGTPIAEATFPCASNVPGWSDAGRPGFRSPLSFRPSKGWVGHLEAHLGGS